jgi:hypothetical protein
MLVGTVLAVVGLLALLSGTDDPSGLVLAVVLLAAGVGLVLWAAYAGRREP